MAIVLNTMYDALSIIEDADTSDAHTGDCICWDFYSSDHDACDACMIEVQKQVEVANMYRCQYGVELTARISDFVQKNMDVLYRISQDHREPMESKDPEDDDSVYAGVRLVNAMQAGYGSDDEYLLLLKNIAPDVYWKWIQDEKKGFACYEYDKGYFEVMIPEIVKDFKDTWGELNDRRSV